MNLLEIVDILRDVRLNNDCNLVEDILYLQKDGVEIGYKCNNFMVSRIFTYQELQQSVSPYHFIDSVCLGMLSSLITKVKGV